MKFLIQCFLIPIMLIWAPFELLYVKSTNETNSIIGVYLLKALSWTISND